MRTDPGRSDAAREPTQSLQLDISDVPEGERESHPSLAMGTSEASRQPTKAESPNGRNRTPEPRAGTKPPPVPANRPDDPDNRIGTTLGAYRITELLGKGGMGYVYRAEHAKLGREVALKLLRGDYAKRRDAVLRFFQEAKTVNRVRHRNIVDVTDFVELDDGTTFIIMELLRGGSLGKWARTGIDMPRALAVLVQICDGLAAAHAVGVIHRDLKPDNVVVVPTSDGAELVKLLDFGVAKLLNRDDHEDIGFQTAAGSVIGTPAYMSPEQAGGMVVDHRSDIYSLGAIMYELFCGQPMFRGRSFGEYVRKHLTEVPVPPRQTANGSAIEPALEALILRCLAKDPNERFAHILELRDGLLHLLGGLETHPPSYASLAASSIRPPVTASLTQLPAGMPLPPPSVTIAPTPPSIHVSHAWPPEQTGADRAPPSTMLPPEPATPWWVWFVGGAFAVGLGVAGALWYAGSTEPASEPAPAAPVAQPAPPPSAQPSAVPIEPATPTTLGEVRFDSLPTGGVYADGRSAELCRTPCTFNIDLGDGSSAVRTFVVRADGYHDERVEVDFGKPKRDFMVTLTKLPPIVAPAPAPAPAPEPEPDVVVDMSDAPPPKKLKKSADPKPEEPKPEDKPPVDAVKIAPVEPKPADKKPPAGRIDPSDTIDPFRRKK